MSLTAINSTSAPAAIGPYSQAVLAGDYLYVSGQLPMNPGSGEMITGDIKDQTRQVLSNLEAILKAAGAGMDKVVKSEVFLADMGDFLAMNEIYAEFFNGPVKPARQAIEAARLPKDAGVEISCIAYLG